MPHEFKTSHKKTDEVSSLLRDCGSIGMSEIIDAEENAQDFLLLKEYMYKEMKLPYTSPLHMTTL